MKKLLSILLVFTTLFITCMPVGAEDKAPLELDYDALTRNSLLTAGSVDATLLDNLVLPETGANGSTITWDSSDDTVITDKGVVTRPDFTKSVNLTATLSNGADEPLKKVFSFRVPGKNEELDPAHPMPVKGQLIRKDDFNDNTIDAATITTTGTVVEENGKLHLTGAKDVATSAKIYVKEDKTAVTGNFILEFTLYKNGLYSGIQVQTDAIGGKDYGYFYSREYLYEDGNSLWLRGSSADEGGIYTKFPYTTFGAPSTTLKFTILYDSNASTYEVWINNRYAAKRTSMDAGAPDLGTITFTNLGGLATDFYVDDLSCYEVEKGEKVISEENFSGNTVPYRVDAGTATAAVSDGALSLSSSSSGSHSKIYINEGRSLKAGKYAVELSVERTSGSGRFDLVLSPAAGGDAAIIRNWGTNDGIMSNIAPTKGAAYSGSDYIKIADNSNKMDVYAEIDTEAQTVKLTVNGGTREGYTIGGKTNISYIAINPVAATTLKITKFKVISLEDDIGNITEHYADSFSDGVTDTNFAKSTNATWTESNGVMNVANGWIKKEFAKPISEEFVAEISLAGSNTGGVHFYFNDADGANFARVSWQNAGVVYIYNGGASAVEVNNVGTTALHIKAVIDVPNDKFSVWINGVLAGENLPCWRTDKDIASLQIEANGTTGINMDEVLLYSIKEDVIPTVDKLTFDYNKFDKKVCVLSPEADECVVVVASYNGSSLVDVESEEVTLNENGSVLADTSDLNVDGADKISVFLWDGLTNLIPLCESESITDLIAAN